MRTDRFLQALFISSTLVYSTQAFAIDPFQLDLSWKQLDSVNRLKQAYQDLATSPKMQKFLNRRSHQLSPLARITEPEIETTRFQHFFQGVEVLGSVAMHHKGLQGTQITPLTADFDLDIRPTLTQEQAVALAKSSFDTLELKQAPVLKILPSNDEASARLIYDVVLKSDGHTSGQELWVDAHTGELLAEIPLWQTLAPIQIYEADSKCETLSPTGEPIQLDASRCKNSMKNGTTAAHASESAKRAFNNSSKTLHFYESAFGRKSFDNQNSTSVSVVHVGENFANAFWDSENKIMAYGDGDGVTYGDFTRAVDVAGHEMTHGVVSETAQLVYVDESGALNEAFADFFGKMIANDNDWSMGKAIYKKAGKGFRDLARPSSLSVTFMDEKGQRVTKPYPAHTKDQFPRAQFCNRRNDNCWVHVNSTIFGHAAYRLVQSIGKERAQKLLYITLTQYLSARSNFRAARNATLKACQQLYNAKTCTLVKNEFAAVGL